MGTGTPGFENGSYDDGSMDNDGSRARRRDMPMVRRRTLLAGIGGAVVGTAAFMQLGYPPLRNWVQGEFQDTDIPQFRRLRWIDTSAPDSSVKWASAAGDPSQHSSIPSNWTKAAVFVTRGNAYVDQLAGLGAGVVEAYAIPHNGDVQVGIMPDGSSLLNPMREQVDGEAVIGVAGRVGEGTLRANLGFYDLNANRYIPAAAGTIALQQATTAAHLDHDYPDVLLV